jgi:hypothetical protein
MNHLYGAVQRAALFLGLTALLVVTTAYFAWWVLGLLGFHLPVQAVLVVVGLGLGGIAMTSSAKTPRPTPPPPAPRRPLTRVEVEGLVLLHREGAITTEQLRAALGSIVPPAEPSPTASRPRGRR